jgi:hypothetical protein
MAPWRCEMSASTARRDSAKRRADSLRTAADLPVSASFSAVVVNVKAGPWPPPRLGRQAAW